MAIIEVRHVGKSFGSHVVLRGVSLSVNEGEFLTLVGPNGAGKTTFLRILAALSRPSSGQVWVDGWNLADGAAELRQRIGFISHQPLLYGDLTAEENLRFYGRLYSVPDLAARIDEVLQQVGLLARRRDAVRAFSRGMQQRLAIARAILHHPAVMLLDEPYTGLDQQAAAMLDEVMRAVGTHSRTVLMTTHDLERGLEMSDRVAILVNGQVAFEAPRAGLTQISFRQAYQDVVRP
ncbi:MAG: heme ABC exporter ATP-binding protein CcmA [Chloroflexota bacterium]